MMKFVSMYHISFLNEDGDNYEDGDDYDDGDDTVSVIFQIKVVSYLYFSLLPFIQHQRTSERKLFEIGSF